MYGASSGQGSRVASLCPSGTSPVLAFTATMDTELTRLFATNVSGGAATLRVHHVVDGDVVANANALFYDYALAAGTTLQVFAEAINSGIQMKAGDELHVRSSVADAIAFNIYGVTASQAPAIGNYS